jgi:hypothetical protein
MQETSEFVHLTLDLNVWSRILLEKGVVLIDLGLQVAELLRVLIHSTFLFDDI